MFLIVDGAPHHSSAAVRTYVESTGGALTIFYLPPYSPDLNPDEWVWNNVKNTKIYPAVARSQGHLFTIALNALAEPKRLPKTIHGLFGDPTLPISALNQTPGTRVQNLRSHRYIEGLYNRQQLHSGLDYKTPREVHEAFISQQKSHDIGQPTCPKTRESPT